MTTTVQSGSPEINIHRGAVSLSFVSRSHRISVVRTQNSVAIEKGDNEFALSARDQDPSAMQVQNASHDVSVTPGNTSIEIEQALHDANFSKTVLEPTYEQGINRVTISLGQYIRGTTETFYNVEFYAACSIDEEIGDPVYVYAPPVGDRYNVRKVDIFDTAKMPAIGVVKEKSSDTECRILVCGVLEGAYSGLTPGYMLYAGRYGLLVESDDLPDPTTDPHWTQIIGQAASSTDAIIQINPTPCWRIG